jgi:superfamily I DNA/RNA helicase
LETKHVFIPMAKGVFPHAKSTGEEELASERRLAYVAITRGQDNVTILCPATNHVGKQAGPSQFVGEACVPFQGQEKSEGTELKASYEEDFNDVIFDDVNYYPWL